MLIEVKNLKFKYTDKELYNNLSFQLNKNEHVVLVGPNGSGKSTLMNIVAKNIIPDSGEINFASGISYSYLDQHLKVKQNISIQDYLYEIFNDLFEKEVRMQEYFDKLASCSPNEYDKYLNMGMNLQDQLEKANFYALNSTIGNIINGLGISNYGLDTMLEKLSGGQRAKVYLAKMLLDNKDVLLMDEPTNYLDAKHVEWLSKYLQSYPKSFIVISHDEVFIRSFANIVYSLENKELVRYKGNYDFYLKEKDLRQEQYLNKYNKDQRFIKQTEEFINKNIARASTSKQAKSRKKMLDRMDTLEKPEAKMKININFKYSKDLGTEVIKFDNLEVGYTKSLLPKINHLITKNEKVAIVGKNGLGKSTILKTILGVIKPISGSYKINPSADINYFSQGEAFSSNDTPIMYLRGFYPDKTDKELRSILASVAINKDLVLKKMNELSGGEQTKVRLALMMIKPCNLIILDEPTNHLDVYAKECLYNALKNFNGSVILVSHEEDFYDDLIDYVWKM